MANHTRATIAKRILFIGGLQLLLLVVILGRLYVLQVLYADKYEVLSDDNRIRTRLLLPKRGEVFDRKGRILAKNVDNYAAVLLPEDIDDLERVLNFLKEALSLSEDDLKRIQDNIRKKPKFIPIVIKEDLLWSEVSMIELNAFRFPGVSIDHGFKRSYTLKGSAAHILGYVSSPNEEEVRQNKSLILPGAKVGKSALESYYEKILRGTPGQKEVEVDVHGRNVRELSYRPSIPGTDIHLTIDKELQERVEKIFQEREVESGGAVVLDIYTGDVLCMVSVPGFDPDLFYHGISEHNWKTLLNDPHKPMVNKVIAGQYSPASIFKVVVALAALEAGEPIEASYHCPGHHMVGNHRFHCWKKAGHGPVNLYQALIRSCDVYFYYLARRIGEKAIIDMARRLGASQKSFVDLPNEAKGFLADPEWKKRVRKEGWYLGDTILTAIGQAYVLMTPLQMAKMMAQVANGGRNITPRFVKKNASKSRGYISMQPRNIRRVLSALSDAVNKPGGTSYRSRIKEERHHMGGKTGTAQVRRISMAERAKGVRKGDAIPWHLRDNAMFVGFAPVHEPRYALAVICEHKGFGGVHAAPIGKRVLEETQKIFSAKG